MPYISYSTKNTMVKHVSFHPETGRKFSFTPLYFGLRYYIIDPGNLFILQYYNPIFDFDKSI